MARLSVVACIVAGLAAAGPAAAEDLRVVSWNLANLAEAPGKALRGFVRTPADYDQIRAMIAGMAPDVVALQEVGSIPGAEAILGDDYTIQFETRCIANDKQCREDADAIYTAIAYRKDLAGVLETFQIEALAILHTSECANEKPRPVRGGVGVKVRRNGTTYWIPSLHLKAGCKKNGDESVDGLIDDCGTERIQFDILVDWMRNLPGDDAVILAGDFNRELLTATDDMREDVLLAFDPDLSIGPSPASARQCWSGFDFQVDALEAQASQAFPEIAEAGGRPLIFVPTANQRIDYFVARNLPDGVVLASEQVRFEGPRRFEKPSGFLKQCDGAPHMFESGAVLTFAQAYPSDHCPIILSVGE